MRLKSRLYMRLRLLPVVLSAAILLSMTGCDVLNGQANVSSAPDTQETGDTADGTQASGEYATAIDKDSWELKLVNASNTLDEDFEPELELVENGYYFDARAASALAEMLRDARDAGLSPVICSAYRTFEFQEELYENKVSRLVGEGSEYDQALEAAAAVVARPGTSEHNLGLAADIVSLGYQILDDAQADTAECVWLTENCHKYGFILRYPKDKTEITGVIYEPWHFRYVGVEAAAEIMEQGICLEEYLAQ